jgi:predicted nucleic acid-binding protein
VSSLFDLNEPIGLWELPLSPSQYEAACYRALADEKTLVFLDTNVLSAAFRLHQEAREGLFKLLRIPLATKRLVVPAWVANEYVHNAFKATKKAHGFREADLERLRSSLPATKQLSAILHQVASVRDMERIAKRLKVTPAEASRELNLRVEQLTNALGDAGGDLAIDAVHRELLTELRAAFVANDLGQIARMLAEQAAYRRASRIPPGLTDAEKGVAQGDEEAAGNADGDLAVWLEILNLSERRSATGKLPADAQAPSNVLVISQEKKEDFLYRPRVRVAEAAKKIGAEENPDIRLIDPRLVAEFEHRVGHRRVAFVNLESLAAGALASIAEREFQDSVSLFIAAIRKQKRAADTKRDSGDEAPSGEVSADLAADSDSQVGVEPVLPDLAPALPKEAALPSETLPIDAEAVPELQIDEAVMVARNRLASMSLVTDYVQVVTNLLSESRKTEEMAVRRILLTGTPSQPDAAFAVGRAMFVALQYGASKAASLFGGAYTSGSMAAVAEQAFVAGGLFEAFFESIGQLRENVLREGLPMLLDRVSQPGWESTRNFTNAQLTPFAERFFWIPGAEQQILQIRISYEPEGQSMIVRSVTVAYPGKTDIELLRPKQSELQSSYLANTVNIATLRAALSRLSLLPDERVEIRLLGEAQSAPILTLPPDHFINTELVSVPIPA